MKIRWDGIIAIWEIICGLTGAVLTAIPLARGAVTVEGWVSGIAGLILFGLSCLAGFLLWRERDKGFSLSVLAQVLQLPAVLWSGILYTFTAGPALILGYSPATGLWRNPLAAWTGMSLSWSAGRAGSLGVNLVPCIVICYLTFKIRQRRRLALSMDGRRLAETKPSQVHVSRYSSHEQILARAKEEEDLRGADGTGGSG